MADAWWRDAVFYQIYPRSFQDSNGDGVGDLPGITSRLDHLAGREDSLGIDAIWLSPFYRSPMKDFGYDVSDYRDVDPAFGSLADFDTLLREAHRRGIRVIVDLVPNHTSDEHEWFAESRSRVDSPKRDWYVWRPGPDGRPPNNWQSWFEGVGPAWTRDPITGEWYLHHFLPAQPDLNWWNEEVRAAMDEVLRFWLDRGVDGFRVDVAHGLVKDPRLRSNPRISVMGRPAPRNRDLEEVHEVHRRWRRVLDEYEDRMAVGEVHVRDMKRLVRYYGQDDELHMPFNFFLLKEPWSASRFRAVVEQWEALLPPHAWPNATLSNHDVVRHATRYGPARARIAATALLTLRGTPFLYYGEEIGMTNVPIPADRVVDVVGRDGERTPMQWDTTRNAGFTTGEPWLPVAADADRVNVAAQRDDPRSLLSFYRRLIRIRRASAALRRGSYRSLPSGPGVYAYERVAEGERMVVLLNFSEREQRVHLALPDPALVLSTDPGRDAVREQLSLAPNEGLVVRV